MFEGCLEVCNPVSDHQKSSSLTRVPSPTTNAPINLLPGEILAKIFHLIRHPNRNAIRQTCQLWKNVMDELVGIKLRIGTFSEFDPEILTDDADFFPKYHSPSIISNIGIDNLLVGNISDNWEIDHSWTAWLSTIMYQLLWKPCTSPTSLPHFKSPGLVNELKLFGKLSPPHFTHFLQELPCIRVFSITFYALQFLHPSQLQSISSLPHLEVLVVRYGGITEQITEPSVIETYLDLRSILNNLLALSYNRFPKLKYASLDFIYCIDEGLAITKAQIQFLRNHANTIKSFSLEYCILMNDGEFSLLNTPDDHPELTNSLQGQKLVELKELRLLPMALLKLPFCNAWMAIIQDHQGLTDLSVMGVLYQMEFVQELVDKNYSMLTALFIWEIKLFNEDANTVKQLDCRLFNKCESLVKLALRGWTVSLVIPSVINLGELPVSLKHVDLRDMAIRTDDIRILSLEMPHLETLELHFVGNRREMGMDVITLRNIIEQGRLREVRIFRSLNGRISPVGIFNGDHSHPEQIMDTPGGTVAIEMGLNGFYVNITSFMEN